jgi:hypothetical protein
MKVKPSVIRAEPKEISIIFAFGYLIIYYSFPLSEQIQHPGGTHPKLVRIIDVPPQL